MNEKIEQLLFDTEVGTNKLTTQLRGKDTDFSDDDIIALRQCFEGSLIDSLFFDKKIVSNDKIKNLFYETERMKAIEINVLNIYFKMLYEIKDDCFESNKHAKSTFNEWFKRKNENVRAEFDSLAAKNLQNPNDKIEEITKNIASILTYNQRLEDNKNKKLDEIKKDILKQGSDLLTQTIKHLDIKAEEQKEELIARIEESANNQLSFLNKVLFGGIGAIGGAVLMYVLTKI